MATIPVNPACPICFISFRLAAKGSTEAQRLFLDREGHISAQPHYVPRAEALILASNQQIVLGPQAQLRVL